MSFFAYIGPGAGFAVLGSFLILIGAVALGLLSMALLPWRLLWRFVRRRRLPGTTARRCVLIGLDGLDPRRALRLMDAGALPHLDRLRREGVFTSLGSTCPPISPVAWSSFSTGANPGKHNIFDFLNRDLRSVMPQLSSSRTRTWKATSRIPWIGRLMQRQRSEVTLLRRGRPFWALLGDHDLDATVLRVPVTFPVEPFRGRALAAMCTPDLRGTQGEFTVFDSAPVAGDESGDVTSGRRIVVNVEQDRFDTHLPGPELNCRTLSLKLTGRIAGPDRLTLRICGQRHELSRDTYTPWIRLTFRDGRRRIHGIARFLLLSASPRLQLYVTPLNIDPGRPAMPVAHPAVYSIYLAKRYGPFATLGLAEDTWALSSGVIDEDAFLAQCLDIHAERERMFADALAHTRNGLCACVFDITDRVQHMFHRFDADDHPARRPGDDPDGRFAQVIDQVYQRCDQLVGDTLDRLGPRDVLLVVSDHGFTDFRRAVNLNAWLRDHGYLFTLPDAPSEAEYLRNVDWSRTRAYSFGLSGVYLNLAGREGQGIVQPGPEAEALRRDITDGLKALRDPADGAPVLRRVYEATSTYRGPYAAHGPDLVTGFRSGYRASWENAVGRCDGPVLSDNTQAWSGDHCVDREEVPGVLFCNQPLEWATERPPHLVDIGPTILELWGIPAPASMDGRAWIVGQPADGCLAPPAADNGPD